MRFAVFLSVLVLWSATASALTVGVSRPLRPSPALAQALVRLQGELSSVGFEVRLVDAPVTSPSRTGSPIFGAEKGEKAVVAWIKMADEGGRLVADVWIPDKDASRYLVANVAVDPEVPNAAERLAIRALEVLRSGLHETQFQMTPGPSDEAPAKPGVSAPVASPPAVVAPPSPPLAQPAASPERVAVEAGAAAVTSLSRLGPALLPLARIEWAAARSFLVQISLAGLGTSSTVGTAAGAAIVDQQYALVGASYRLSLGPWLWPYATLSAGVMHTSVQGRADPPEEGHTEERWSALADASLGTGLRFSRRFYANFGAHVQLAEPYVDIHVLSEVVATTGRPNLLVTLTLGAWL